MADDFRKRPEFQEGRAGEMLTADWLMRRRDCYIIPSYDYAGNGHNKAPRLQGLWTGYVIPDLDVCGTTRRFWAEVKVKSKPNYRYTTNTYEHGINNHLIEHYRSVQLISGSPVLLFIYEKSSRWLLTAKLDSLPEPRFGRERGDEGGALLANWNRDFFTELEQIGEGEFDRFLKLAADEDGDEN